MNFGGHEVPRVIADFSKKEKISAASLFAAGYNYSVPNDKWNLSDQACDYIFAGDHEIVDVLRMTLYKFTDGGGKPEKMPIPEEEKAKAEELHKELIEAIASNDETLMEKYFDKG